MSLELLPVAEKRRKSSEGCGGWPENPARECPELLTSFVFDEQTQRRQES